MGNHTKMFGICENKCLVEVSPKDETDAVKSDVEQLKTQMAERQTAVTVKYADYSAPVPVMKGDEYSTDNGATWTTVESNGQLAYPFSGYVRYKKTVEGDMPAYNRVAVQKDAIVTAGSNLITPGAKVAFELGNKAYVCDAYSTKVDVYDLSTGVVTAGTPLSENLNEILKPSDIPNSDVYVYEDKANPRYVFDVDGRKWVFSRFNWYNGGGHYDIYDSNGVSEPHSYPRIKISNVHRRTVISTILQLGSAFYIVFYWGYEESEDHVHIYKLTTDHEFTIFDPHSTYSDGRTLGYNMISFKLGNKAYFGLGRCPSNSNADKALNKIDENGVIESIPAIPVSNIPSWRGYMFGTRYAFNLNDCAYIYASWEANGGGFKKVLKLDRNEVFTWVDAPSIFYYSPSIVVQNHVLIIGGTKYNNTSSFKPSADIVRMDANEVFKTIGQIRLSNNNERMRPGLVSANNKIYVFGGGRDVYPSNTTSLTSLVDIIEESKLYDITYYGMIAGTQYTELQDEDGYTFMESATKKTYTETVENVEISQEVPKTWHYKINYRDGIIS